ncbi:hypothetical protein M9H77_00415 [Catharanthus roseus]|nr:hypothetical protein M9H77_00415 [Catharanthus roseus]
MRRFDYNAAVNRKDLAHICWLFNISVKFSQEDEERMRNAQHFAERHKVNISLDTILDGDARVYHNTGNIATNTVIWNFSDNFAKLSLQPSKQRTTRNIWLSWKIIASAILQPRLPLHHQDEVVAKQSVTIKHMIEDSLASKGPILLLKSLRVVTQLPASENDVDLKAFVYALVNGLLSLACEDVLDMIKRKDPEHIYKIFNITSDFFPKRIIRRLSTNSLTFLIHP